MTQRTPPLDEADLDLLSAYIDDQLGGAERAALEGRLAQEPDLRQALDELRSTVYVLRTLPQVTPPRSFTLDVSVTPARPWYAWITPGLLRFGSGLAALLLLVSFLPDLLAGFGRGLSLGMGGAAPAGAAPTAASVFSGASTAAPERAMIAAQPTAAAELQPQAELGTTSAPAATPELASGAAPEATPQSLVPPAATAVADMAGLPPTSAAEATLPPMAALPAEQQPKAAEPYAGSQPIATSGSSSPDTALLDHPPQDAARAIPPELAAPAEPAEPVSPWTLLRLFLALAVVGLGLAAWGLRRDT